jgi:hypothetical protein
MQGYQIQNNEVQNDEMIPVNVDITNFIKENFEYENFPFMRQEDLEYRTLFDSYWTTFYNEKAKNFQTNLHTMEFFHSHPELQKVYGNQFEEKNVNLNATEVYKTYKDDGSLDMANSYYFDYYCLPDAITKWKILPKRKPRFGSLYVTSDLEKIKNGCSNNATVIFKIPFEELQYRKVKRSQPISGSIQCDGNSTTIMYHFTIRYATNID